jgi:predicted RecB family nuclease
LGFNWQDETPSGAFSIQWFNELIETGDQRILNRLLVYNEDDCKATMVLKEALEKLTVKN